MYNVKCKMYNTRYMKDIIIEICTNTQYIYTEMSIYICMYVCLDRIYYYDYGRISFEFFPEISITVKVSNHSLNY